MDLLDFLRSLREPYENNLPSGGPPRAPRLPQGPRIAPAPQPSGSLERDIHAFTPEVEDNPQGPFMGGRDRLRAARTALEQRRAQAQDELEGRKYPGEEMIGRLQTRFKGTTPGSPEFFARATGEDPSTMIHPEEGTPMRGALAAGPFEDTELRRGAPPAPVGRGALDPARNPDDIGGVPGDRRRLTPQQRLEVLKAQLSDPDRDPTFESQLRQEIALLERQIGGGKTIPIAGAPPATEQGALSADPWESAMGESSQQNAALGAVGALGGGEQAVTGPMAAAAGPTVAPREALADVYRKRVAAIEKETGEKLTDQQKAELQLDFFLRLMSAGTKRGATLLGAAGESGLATSALSRGMRDKNMASARQKRTEAREDVFREVGFSDKDADNASRERQLGITEAHYKNLDQRDAQRLKLLEEQLKQGKWTAVNNARTGTVVMYDKVTGETKDTGIKFSAKDERPAEIQLLEYVAKNPQALNTLIKIKGRGDDEAERVFKAAMKLVEGDPAGSTADAVARAREAWRLSSGGHANDGIARPKSEEEFKKLPPGSKFINPKDGKTYTKK